MSLELDALTGNGTWLGVSTRLEFGEGSWSELGVTVREPSPAEVGCGLMISSTVLIFVLVTWVKLLAELDVLSLSCWREFRSFWPKLPLLKASGVIRGDWLDSPVKLLVIDCAGVGCRSERAGEMPPIRSGCDPSASVDCSVALKLTSDNPSRRAVGRSKQLFKPWQKCETEQRHCDQEHVMVQNEKGMHKKRKRRPQDASFLDSFFESVSLIPSYLINMILPSRCIQLKI